MLIYHQFKLNYFHTDDDVMKKISKILHVSESEIISWKITKKSIDARKKPQIFVVYSLLITVNNEDQILKKVKDHNLSKYEEKNTNILLKVRVY